MAIVKMNEFSLLAFVHDKESILKALQRFGGVQFRELQAEEAQQFLKKSSVREQVSRCESELAKVKFALEKITPYAERPTGFKTFVTPKSQITYAEFDGYIDSYDYSATYETIKAHDEKLKSITAEYNKLKSDNENFKGWSKLDISPLTIDSLKSVRYIIGVVVRTQVEGFRENFESRYPESYVEMLNTTTDGQLALVVVPAGVYDDASTFLKDQSFSKINVNFEKAPEELIAQNEKRMQELSVAEIAENSAIKSCAADYSKLIVVYDYFRTGLERANAGENFLNSEKVLLVEGWVADEDTQKLENIISEVCKDGYYLETNPVAEDSAEVPIKLKNNSFVRAFEDITSMYSLPRYNEIDPTPVMAPFYFLFFGIMVGDAGYGLLLLVATFVAKKFLVLGKGTKNFMNFLFCLSFATILAGTLFGSMFGFTFFAPIATADGGHKAILDSQVDIVTMLILSIVIGVIQILFGLCVKGYMLVRDGKPLDALFDSVAFIVTLLGAIGWLLGIVLPELSGIAGIGMWAFIVGVVVLAATQGRESPSLVGKIAGGLYSVYGLTSYVGDFVSYTRLVALSLSGAYIAYSFNLMASIIPAGPFGIVRFLAGGLIMVLGQSLNIGLSVLGAYVHSCRLQYVEFFGKFYEGGGRPFKPFEMKNEAIEITN